MSAAAAAAVRIFIGGPTLLPDCGRPTGMYKQPLAESAEAGREGLTGDHQADRRVHGGPDKAIHLYPAEHYRRLAGRFPEAAAQLLPGSLGENLSCEGLTEADVRLGDIYALGGARLQFSQPRSPCWKIDSRFGVEGMAAHIAESGLTGWYWRVLQPGRVTSGDRLLLLERTAGAPTLAAAMDLWRQHRPAPEALERIAAAPGIAAGWRRKFLERAAWLRRAPDTAAPPVLFHVKPAD